MPWAAIAYVSSGLTLVAFIIATAAWVIKVQAEEKRKLIESANDQAKAALVDRALDLVHVDTSGLTREQKYNLAMELIKRRAERFRIVAIVVCFLALSGSGVAIYSRVQIDDKSPLDPLIREVHMLQAVAAGMSSGPLDKVREVYSKAQRLGNDIRSVNGINKLPYMIDQARYAATAYLFASDAARTPEKQEKFAKETIEFAKRGMALVADAKAIDPVLSQKLSNLCYEDKLRHLYFEAALTLAFLGDKSYERKYKSMVSDFDEEYFRKNIGDDFEMRRKARLNEIKQLWESSQ